MNKLTHVNEGKSHEENPLGGVPVGNSNTVEQGETIKNNFVYSNRITLTPEIIKQYNLPTSLANKTVADATKFIDSKFKDRTDKISMSTKNGMLSKIAEAQEAMKPIELSQSIEPGNTLGQNQMFLGGEMEGVEGVPGLDSGMQGIQQLIAGDKEGALSSGIKAGTTVAGTAIGGPVGGMIGGVIGDIAGSFVGAGRKKREAEKLARNNHIQASTQFSNDFAYGGKMYSGGGLLPMLTSEQIVRLKTPYGGLEKTDYMSNRGTDLNTGVSNTISINDLSEKNGYSNPELAPLVSTTNMGINPTSDKLPKADLSKLGNTLGQAARYAPIAMNAYQLSQLKKPSYSRLNRLDQRFNPEYVDERSLQNIVSNETNNSINALTGAVNGSVGALRSNILGAGLNRTKALSNAYMDAEAQNRAMNMQGQQFNAGINAANLQQDNLELDINDRNSAAYRNAKRDYLTGIGEGIGDIGKEEIYKKIAMTTTGYNFLGKFMEQNPNATPEQALEAAKKAGVVANDTTITQTTSNALGGYLFKNKRK